MVGRLDEGGGLHVHLRNRRSSLGLLGHIPVITGGVVNEFRKDLQGLDV